MASSLSVLSGKGGSGKTTLAISLTQLFALCGKNVLLVDCDMSTHGATYFFEDYFTDKESYLIFKDLLNDNIIINFNLKENIIVDDKDNIKHFLRVNISNVAHFDFLPSCISFKTDYDINSTYRKSNGITSKNIAILSKYYDVMIFDCQAGYSNVTNNILEYSNKNLMVLEPDAVSVIAVRVLYSQLSSKLDEKKTFQVFSKVIEEEHQLYKNIPPHATIFTNLDPISFNWSVRKAFAISILPEIDEKNPELTNEIFNLAVILFPEYKIDLQKYIINVKKVLIEQAKAQITLSKKQRTKDTLKKILLIVAASFFVVSLGCYALFIYGPSPETLKAVDDMINYLTVGSIIFAIYFLFMVIITYNSNRNRKHDYLSIYNMEQNLLKIENEVSNLEKTLLFDNKKNIQ